MHFPILTFSQITRKALKHKGLLSLTMPYGMDSIR